MGRDQQAQFCNPDLLRWPIYLSTRINVGLRKWDRLVIF
jgi:hypothetical protein